MVSLVKWFALSGQSLFGWFSWKCYSNKVKSFIIWTLSKAVGDMIKSTTFKISEPKFCFLPQMSTNHKSQCNLCVFICLCNVQYFCSALIFALKTFGIKKVERGNFLTLVFDYKTRCESMAQFLFVRIKESEEKIDWNIETINWKRNILIQSIHNYYFTWNYWLFLISSEVNTHFCLLLRGT